MNQKISDSEYIIMDIIWSKHPIGSKEIIDQLDSSQWTPQTIKTLINRLLKKEIIDYKKEGRFIITILYMKRMSF